MNDIKDDDWLHVPTKDDVFAGCKCLNVKWDYSVVLCSMPPKYKGQCEACNRIVYRDCTMGNVNDVNI